MLKLGAWPCWREVAAPVPEAIVTVLCTPDDGCGWHPKHVEWTCRIINRLLCVAYRWTFINIDQSHSYAPANYADQLLVIFQRTLCLCSRLIKVNDWYLNPLPGIPSPSKWPFTYTLSSTLHRYLGLKWLTPCPNHLNAEITHYLNILVTHFLVFDLSLLIWYVYIKKCWGFTGET